MFHKNECKKLEKLSMDKYNKNMLWYLRWAVFEGLPFFTLSVDILGSISVAAQPLFYMIFEDGHADVDMTKHYLHVQDPIRIAAITKFDRAFAEEPETHSNIIDFMKSS